MYSSYPYKTKINFKKHQLVIASNHEISLIANIESFKAVSSFVNNDTPLPHLKKTKNNYLENYANINIDLIDYFANQPYAKMKKLMFPGLSLES
jgi:hypothetical protein